MHSNAKQMFENRYGLILTDKCFGIFIFTCSSHNGTHLPFRPLPWMACGLDWLGKAYCLQLIQAFLLRSVSFFCALPSRPFYLLRLANAFIAHRMRSGFGLQLLILLLFLACGAYTTPVGVLPGGGVDGFFPRYPGGGDGYPRRRYYNWWKNWWTFSGLADVTENTEDYKDDYDIDNDNEHRWLQRAKDWGFARQNQKGLRSSFFYKGSIEKQYIEN